MVPARRQPEPTLRTARLTLRPLRQTDLDDIVAGVGDYDVAKMVCSFPHPYRRADAEAFLAAARVAVREGRSVEFAVERNGETIGVVRLLALPRQPEIAFWFSRRAWGNGHATEAATALLAYGFDVLQLPLVHYRVFIDNPASRRLMAKLGFNRVGFGASRSLARGREVAHIHGVLTKARFARRRGP
jgi:8-oxo-dGTP diphosphatase